MAQVNKSILVGYSAARMFTLVDQVEDYPSFLPWCGGTELKCRDQDTTVATIHIDYHRIRQSFTTRNTKQEPHLIEMRLQDGPFSQLEGSWRFTELDSDACKVEFHLRYEFSSRVLEKLVGPVFDYIANSFVDAFTRRADEIYGGT